jgi:hypothetical protein
MRILWAVALLFASGLRADVLVVASSGASHVTLIDPGSGTKRDLALPRSGAPLVITCARQKALLEIDPWTGEEVKRHALVVRTLPLNDCRPHATSKAPG